MGENKKRPLEWRTRLASNQPKPPATVLNNNDDVIAILRRDRATLEGSNVEIPLRRSQLSVFVVARQATFYVELNHDLPVQLPFLAALTRR